MPLLHVALDLAHLVLVRALFVRCLLDFLETALNVFEILRRFEYALPLARHVCVCVLDPMIRGH